MNTSIRDVSRVSVPVSVIVPCYNSAPFLSECIRSINSKNSPDEIVIIDDCSTDQSLSVAQQLADSHPNITIIKRSVNGGAAAARKVGIDAARNPWIALVDADDVLEDDAVHDAFAILENECADMCIWDMWRFDNGSNFRFIDLQAGDFPKTGRQAVIDTLGQWKIHPLGVARKDIYSAAYDGFQQTMLNADELITRIVFSKAEKIVFCPSKYFYRLNSESTTAKFTEKSVTYLYSYNWLLRFSAQYPEVQLQPIAKKAIASAWRMHRDRKLLGDRYPIRVMSSFLKEFGDASGLMCLIWVWQAPKLFMKYIFLTIFYRCK